MRYYLNSKEPYKGNLKPFYKLLFQHCAELKLC